MAQGGFGKCRSCKKRSLSDFSDFGERGAVSHSLHTGFEFRKEGACLDRVMHKFGQVLDDDDGLPENLLGGGGCVQRAA